jgi:hypothetical protein
MKYNIYLDDVRTPNENSWVVVRNYDEFVSKVTELGLNNIDVVSLDHDLGDTAMNEYFNNVSPNYTLNYDNIKEKTGLDCAKWLVNHFYDTNLEWIEMNRIIKRGDEINFPTVYTHSANPIGSANIMGYINNFLMNEAQPQTCVRVQIPHTV